MSDLARLFAEDPLNLTAEDLNEIIAGYRAARANFNLTGKSTRSTGKEKVSAIDLDDLLGGTANG